MSDILKAAGEFLNAVADAITKAAGELRIEEESPVPVELAETEMNEDDTAEEETLAPSQMVRATIKSARREMDPVKLQGWSRVIFTCEDGEERKMYFSGPNGVYLTEGENGVLEHRDGRFISFEKDSGEIVGAMYHILPEEE